ncbi:Calcineurin-like metallo-phosphoesterase superfamily protein [Perilla frutescens var. frutescens]|nr:Calcineurin-like metallo-phosphoesterase superfamily protein [Perilla frutescens var. frutescens]
MANATATTVFLLLSFAIPFSIGVGSGDSNNNRRVVEVEGSPDDLVWAVQLSDLHFSVHHPLRAQDFRDFVGPALSFIKPSLVFLTGDLTDGKSKDLLTMKQDEEEWIEYQKVMQDVVKKSGLDQRIFYDVRGNHDNFGVPVVGGSFDFFSRYSINGQLQRSGKVNSITIQTSKRKLLFVGFDSTMSSGLRGPTNLFGHPTDELLAEIDSELLQWDSQSDQPVTKLSFGHFPLSFSAASKTGKTLKDIFMVRSLTAYLCGHLHVKFGKNLKRHHHSGHHAQNSKQLFQLSGNRLPSEAASSSEIDESTDGFWEWEMGDWRKSRTMRILAIDRGHISFVDVNFTSGAKKTIILPTFPLDSRFSSASSQNYKCDSADPSSCGVIRALVFSASPIASVLAKVYDTSSGNLIVVLDTQMTKLAGSRGDLYVAPWHIQAFEDPSPDRYALQIEATDFMGRTTTTELRPFSVNGIPARFPWSLKEFFVMGCQWDSLYYPILWGFYCLVLSALLIPRALLSFSRRQYTYITFRTNKSFINGLLWISMEIYSVPVAWFGMIGYLFYLVSCPWLYGQVFTQDGEQAYMTYRGWVWSLNDLGKPDFLGSPDVMVVVLPHLIFVVLPSMVTTMALAAESSIHRDYLLSLSSKKKNDSDAPPNNSVTKTSETSLERRWLRKLFLVVSLAISWKHFKNCEALMKAYEMNPITHFPVYSLAVPLLLAYTIWKTRRNATTTSTK